MQCPYSVLHGTQVVAIARRPSRAIWRYLGVVLIGGSVYRGYVAANAPPQLEANILTIRMTWRCSSTTHRNPLYQV